MSLILQQDDRAPDALEYFEREFIKLTGQSLTDFKDGAARIDTDEGEHIEWCGGEFKLCVSADDPFYSLHHKDESLIQRKIQTQPLNCVSACLAMLTDRNVDDVSDEFHKDYMDAKLNVHNYLDYHKIPYERLLSEQRGPQPDMIYIAAVPSLNLRAHMHQILIETNRSDQWWVHDPNNGRDGKEFYTASTIKAYVLEYAIPREWLRGRRS